ncbi:MAG: hypothetical protein A3I78_06630 [Gammaproteobacteria bacterium RIFCSPLOWO2_02_FULL_56_15]|nr:MAG: hypothetical protein A3I78_06630 [Gammaproteobacteria bacterium RIFCSPLOWO2_02_FULL_56_15]
MVDDRNRPYRRSLRLRGYDYTRPGAYFITICIQDRACLFGEVADGEMRLNAAGRMVSNQWTAMPLRFPGIDMDEFTVMPNHIHAILKIVGAPLVGARRSEATATAAVMRATARVAPTGNASGDSKIAHTRYTSDVGAGLVPAQGDQNGAAMRATTRVAPTVGDVIGAFKSLTTMEYRRGVITHGWPALYTRLWQRNFYEHVIRDDDSLNRVRWYILDNPSRWESDLENPGTMVWKSERS